MKLGITLTPHLTRLITCWINQLTVKLHVPCEILAFKHWHLHVTRRAENWFENT